jgi:hypothetical protein
MAAAIAAAAMNDTKLRLCILVSSVAPCFRRYISTWPFEWIQCLRVVSKRVANFLSLTVLVAERMSGKYSPSTSKVRASSYLERQDYFIGRFAETR